MKYTNLQAFEKHLADAGPNHFAEVYLITAKDPFERKQATDLLTTKLLAKKLYHIPFLKKLITKLKD